MGMMRQYDLVDAVRAYHPGVDEDLLDRAYVFAMLKHGKQTRANGDPYFSHPLEVAGILTRLKLDEHTIAAALLHDTLEDTDTTPEELSQRFGPSVAQLVEGVTKLTQYELKSDASRQAENFRKLILAVSRDIRVLLIKLADRLHNMRTLHFIRDDSRKQRIALETLEIYAPLAERIGLFEYKDELEDLAFRTVQPEAWSSITTRLDFLRDKGDRIIDRIIAALGQLMAENALQAEISGREKSPCSIWRKMQRKAIEFEQLSDIMAFRLMVPDVAACYQALGLIHGTWRVVPGRFKDYISTPKPNGYASIHTTVLWPEGQKIEIQIRTPEMHEVAQLGVAAHWSYKQGAEAAASDQDRYRWLRSVLEIVESAAHPDEFLEHTKLELYSDQVFCFTPKGDLFTLPSHATPVDFAYAVHSDLGDTCVGAKVNGKIMPLSSTLHNGDQVDILTSRNQRPNPDWLDFVVTGKARAHIRRFIRQSQRAEHATLGRALLERQFRQEGYDFTEKAVQGVLKTLRLETSEDAFAAIGEGHLSAREVFTTIFPGHRRPEPAEPAAKPRAKPAARPGAAMPINGLIPGMAMHYARCCHPIPGDRIVGIITTGKGVTIHTIDCDTLAVFADQPERWLDVSWDEDGLGGSHVSRIRVIMTNERGNLATVTTIIAKNGGNIVNLSIRSRSVDFWDMAVDVEVENLKHMTNIIAALRAAKPVASVDRDRG